MNSQSNISWRELFEPAGANGFALKLIELQKCRETLLLLPESTKLASKALVLYPAQTRFARAARLALRLGLRMGLSGPLAKTSVIISSEDAFAQFLINAVGGKTEAFPPLAILCGNARVEGRRFILLLFEKSGAPKVVVKAGIGESARQLVLREKLFLESVAADVPGIPKIRASHSSARIEAIAIPYIEGKSPTGADWRDVGKLLGPWLDHSKKVSADDIPAWQKLKAMCGSGPHFRELTESMNRWKFSPALFHGDFAPWNLKVSNADGGWMALDWERGELVGFPSWDWIHYIIQTGILVEKRSPHELAAKLETLLASSVFRDYAQRAGIEGREKVLAISYLFYSAKIIRQTEGLPVVEALLTLLKNAEPK